jgi:predicted DNA-binding transcriptional regulator AlpA
MFLTAGLIHALPTSDRRCFDRKEAASFVGISVGTFDKLVKGGELPQPILLRGRKVWDRRSLDTAIDRMSGLEPTDTTNSDKGIYELASPLDEWRRTSAKD